MIKIVVDSTCDLDDSFIKKYNIEVLPLRISVNNEEFLDKVNVSVDYIYEKMREETRKLKPVLTQQSKENNGYSKHNLYKYRPGRKYAK